MDQVRLLRAPLSQTLRTLHPQPCTHNPFYTPSDTQCSVPHVCRKCVGLQTRLNAFTHLLRSLAHLNRHCVQPTFPVFDLSFPDTRNQNTGPYNLGACPCAVFAANGQLSRNQSAAILAAEERELAGAGDDDSSVTLPATTAVVAPLPCSDARSMATIRAGLFGRSGTGATASIYLSSLFLYNCRVNSTMVAEMFALPQLGVLQLINGLDIEPPLVLPPSTTGTAGVLGTLELSHMGVTSESLPGLPPSILVLKLDGNVHLDQLPTSIRGLVNLWTLIVRGCAITTVPAWVGDLRQLARLELAQNKITALPAEVGKLVALNRLNVANNGLVGLPATLAQLTKLTFANFGGNPLTDPQVPIILGLAVAPGAETWPNPFTTTPKIWPALRWLQLAHTSLTGDEVPFWKSVPGVTPLAAVGLWENTLPCAGLCLLAQNDYRTRTLGIFLGGTRYGASSMSSNATASVFLRDNSTATASQQVDVLTTIVPSCGGGCPSIEWKARLISDWRGNGRCDPECNSEECGFDGGDCGTWTTAGRR